jgi:hypothetical protein
LKESANYGDKTLKRVLDKMENYFFGNKKWLASL